MNLFHSNTLTVSNSGKELEIQISLLHGIILACTVLHQFGPELTEPHLAES